MALFEKYGGRAFWEDAVSLFYDRLMHDPLLLPFFTGKDVNKVKGMITHLLECTLGDNTQALEVSIRRVHADMGVQKRAFNRFLELFTGVLRDEGVSDEDMDDIGDVLSSFEDDVVTA